MESERSGGRRGRLLGGAGASLGVLALVASAAYPAQRLLLFPAPRPARPPVTDEGRLLTIERPGLPPVYAVHFEAPPGAMTALLFHGNGEQLADMMPLSAALARAGIGVLAVEYPGYGLAAAETASEASLYAAGEVATRHALETLHVPADRLALVGHSLGTGVVTELAARGLGAKLVLVSPYTSIPDMAAKLVPFFPARHLVRDRFDSLSKAPHIEAPALVIHGDSDELIPVEMGRALARAFPHATLAVVVSGHHNDLFATHGRRVVGLIRDFLR